jgi:T-complex protein 1 subunit beta
MNVFSHMNAGTTEEKGDEARKTFSMGTGMIGEIVGTTLGPRGMLKILQHEDKISVSNDGATILKNLKIDSPTARILINASVSQDWEEGDGTTTVALLSSLLVEHAAKLDIHPLKIIRGYQRALDKCLGMLEDISKECDDNDLINLANTTLCSKIVNIDLKKFSKTCVQAVNNLEGRTDLDLIQIIKCAGRLEDSYLDDGFILHKNIEVETLKNPKILVANTPMDTDKIKVFGAKVCVKSIDELSQIEEAEKKRMREKVERICTSKIGCFINRQLIYDYPLQLFRENKVVPIEHADFDGVGRLTNVLGGKIMSTFEDLSDDCFGTCEEIKNVFVGNERMIKFSGVKKGACTIVLRGSSKEVLDEAERSVHDALCVLSRIKESGKIVYGGGCAEMEMALSLNKYAVEVVGKESEAVLAFSNALQEIPKILASNGGYDGEEIKSKLRSSHSEGRATYGVNMDGGGICCMKEKGVVESLRIKKRVIHAACEVAQMIIKCDGVVKCKPRERTRE